MSWISPQQSIWSCKPTMARCKVGTLDFIWTPKPKHSRLQISLDMADLSRCQMAQNHLEPNLQYSQAKSKRRSHSHFLDRIMWCQNVIFHAQDFTYYKNLLLLGAKGKLHSLFLLPKEIKWNIQTLDLGKALRESRVWTIIPL